MRRFILAIIGVGVLLGFSFAAVQADPPVETPAPEAEGQVILLVEDPNDAGSGSVEDPTANPDPDARAINAVPRAHQNWHPRPDCMNFNKVGGDIPSAFKFSTVLTEYENKVPNLPNLVGLSASCPSGADAVARIDVDYVPNPARNYCARYLPRAGNTSLLQLSLQTPNCDGEARQWSCSGIGASVGGELYNGDNNGRGCWYVGGGNNPSTLSSGFQGSEANVLNVAWN